MNTKDWQKNLDRLIKSKQPIKRIEKFRQMNTREFAIFLNELGSVSCQFCASHDEKGCHSCFFTDCVSEIEKWLDSEGEL